MAREIRRVDPAALVAVAHEVLDAGVQFELLHVAAKVERETAVHLINALTDDQLDEIAAGAPGALQYLGDRFAGKPPTNTCAAIPH